MDKISLYWSSYEKALTKQGVKPSARRWYVVRVEQYIKSARGRKLASHSAEEVTTYLAALGRMPYVKAWQLQQSAHALQILFCQVINASWSQDVDWTHWREDGLALPVNHATIARDSNPVPVMCRDGKKGTQQEILNRLVVAIRSRHYSIRTEQVYLGWIRRFFNFHAGRSPVEMGAAEVSRFLEDLVVRGKVSASTQNQALNALVFLFTKVLDKPFGDLGDFARSKQPRRLPVVLSRGEVNQLLNALTGIQQLMAGLLYGSGFRLMECVRLRVKDVDFEYCPLMIRNGKGGKDRLVPLPKRFVKPLKNHLMGVQRLHHDDLGAGLGEVYLPEALARKYPKAAREWGWQYVFPSSRFSLDPRSGLRRRHHIHENGLQKAVKKASEVSGITKKVNCHALRHSFATHLLERVTISVRFRNCWDMRMCLRP